MYIASDVLQKVRIRGVVFLTLLITFTLLSNKGSIKKTNLTQRDKRPNILFVISDDQSYPHASAYGYKAINTPAFDRIAREGALFTNAIVASQR